jgi:hypothetical protein
MESNGGHDNGMEAVIPKEFLTNDIGIHNGQLDDSIARLVKGNTYRDLSTIWITPTRGTLKPRVVSSWMALMRPMNQPFVGPLFIEQDEVGIAYQKMFDMVLDHPELSKWRYILTVEEDNLPPSDGLLKLYESIEKGYDCVAGLYWVKGPGGQPMIYGNPNVMPRNFAPQIPLPDALQHCNGTGMGFNLWRIESFQKKLKDMPKPWFKTVQEKGSQFTQDLFFFNNAAMHGFKVASDNRVKVGHLDSDGIVW